MARDFRIYQIQRYITYLFLINYYYCLQMLIRKCLDINYDDDSKPDEQPSESTVDNEILYQGRRYDTESNLYFYRARYYDPIMGRFLSTDPLGYKDSMNLYQSFNMNGMNFVDPFGKQLSDKEIELKEQVYSLASEIQSVINHPHTKLEKIESLFNIYAILSKKARVNPLNLDENAFAELSNLRINPPSTKEQAVTFFNKMFSTMIEGSASIVIMEMAPYLGYKVLKELNTARAVYYSKLANVSNRIIGSKRYKYFDNMVKGSHILAREGFYGEFGKGGIANSPFKDFMKGFYSNYLSKSPKTPVKFEGYEWLYWGEVSGNIASWVEEFAKMFF